MEPKKQLTVTEYATVLVNEAKEITDLSLESSSGSFEDKLAFVYLYAQLKSCPRAVVQEAFKQRFNMSDEVFTTLMNG